MYSSNIYAVSYFSIKVFVLSAFVLSFVGIVQCFAHKPIYTDNDMSTNDRRCSRGETKGNASFMSVLRNLSECLDN